MAGPVQIIAVIQNGRLAYEALLFMATWAAQENAGFEVVLAEPQPGPLWDEDPRVHDPQIRQALKGLGAHIRPFETQIWGSRYPNGNKIEALSLLDPARPFIFFDTDTIFLAPLPAAICGPTASVRVEPTWPRIRPHGPAAHTIWSALYDLSGLPTPNPTPYFNAGFFAHAQPAPFATAYRRIAHDIETAGLRELADQSLFPWLDQIALPITLSALGPIQTPPPGIDTTTTCHWRTLPLLYARESHEAVAAMEAASQNRVIKPLLKRWPPAKRFLYGPDGPRARALFASGPPKTEKDIRKALKTANLWIR